MIQNPGSSVHRQNAPAGRNPPGEQWVLVVLCAWAVILVSLLGCLFIALARRSGAGRSAEEMTEEASGTAETGIVDMAKEETASEQENREMAAAWTGENGDTGMEGGVGTPAEDEQTLSEEAAETAREEQENSAGEASGAVAAAREKRETGADKAVSDLKNGLAGAALDRLGGAASQEASSSSSASTAASSSTAAASASTGASAAEGSTGEEETREAGAPAVSTSVRNLIIDMDYNGDVDDVCALAVAAQLHCEGRINLLAVTLSTSGRIR